MGKQETPTTLAERVRYVRGFVPGLSSRTFSRIAGLSESMVGAIERGDKAVIGNVTAEKLASACNVTLDWLLAGRGAGPKLRPTAEHLRAGWARLPPPGKSGPKGKAVSP